MVDYLKQYDTDNKGALSTEEVQAAIRGAVRSEVSGKDFHRMYSGMYRMMEF